MRRCSSSLATGECSALGKMGLRFLHFEELERKELSSMFYRISDYMGKQTSFKYWSARDSYRALFESNEGVDQMVSFLRQKSAKGLA